MSSREAILAKVKASLSGGASEKTRRSAVAARLKAHSAGIVPASQDEGRGLVSQFARKAGEASASVEIVRRDRIARAITKFLRDHNLPQSIRCGSDARLRKIGWQKIGSPEILNGPSEGNDLVGLSHAYAGISETGTLVLLSGPENPTTINFLPENHVVLVEASEIAGSHEAVWKRLRRKTKGALPRTVNMVTGPSRSADIEQTLILGAHGPVRLHIIIVRD